MTAGRKIAIGAILAAAAVILPIIALMFEILTSIIGFLVIEFVVVAAVTAAYLLKKRMSRP